MFQKVSIFFLYQVLDLHCFPSFISFFSFLATLFEQIIYLVCEYFSILSNFSPTKPTTILHLLHFSLSNRLTSLFTALSLSHCQTFRAVCKSTLDHIWMNFFLFFFWAHTPLTEFFLILLIFLSEIRIFNQHNLY